MKEHSLSKLGRPNFRNGDCILWQGATQGGGYGIARVNGKPVLAHRLAYENNVGPIPPGMHIDHLCRTPLCVNHDHLEAVTPRENTLRGLRGRMRTQCAQGHGYTGENTHRRPSGQRRCKICIANQNVKTENRRRPVRLAGAETVLCECGTTVRRGGIQLHRVRKHREVASIG